MVDSVRDSPAGGKCDLVLAVLTISGPAGRTPEGRRPKPRLPAFLVNDPFDLGGVVSGMPGVEI
jgi:hypothetical protein